MKTLVTLRDFICKAESSGLDLYGCFIQGPQYNYQFRFLVDEGIEVGYGGDFRNKGTLRRSLMVSRISFGRIVTNVRNGDQRIIIHCHT